MGRFGLRYDTTESAYQRRQLEQFLLDNPGDYDPETYGPWVHDVCMPDVRDGRRIASGLWQDGEMAGDSIVKPEGPGVILLRHFRINTVYAEVDRPRRIKGLGSFTLEQVPLLGARVLADQGLIDPEVESIAVQLDTRAGSTAESFFVQKGFAPIGRGEYYTPGKQDVTLERTFHLEQFSI